MSTSDHTPSDLESVRERLNVVTQETRFALLQDILGHPSELPTLKELDYVNPSKSQTTIRQHLQQLVDAGIVEEVPHEKFSITVEYDDSGSVRGILESADCEFEATYEAEVSFEVRAPEESAADLRDRIRSATSGRALLDGEFSG